MLMQEKLVFYTDGSLYKAKSKEEGPDRMGIGILQTDLNEQEVIEEGYARTQNWPSSTKPELLAIWLAVLATPSKKEIKVFTDSAVAIESIEKERKILTNKQWLKLNNYDLIHSIVELVKIKEIHLELEKIKSHSNNRWNDRADRLAKKGASIENCDSIIYNPPLRSNVTLHWEEVLFEHPAREITKILLDLKTGADWKESKVIQKVEPKEDQTDNNWTYLWKKTKKNKGIRCTSLKQSKRLGTLFKCANEMLPVMETLSRRRPDLYQDARCIICNENEEENQDHLTCCKEQESN